MLLAATPPMGWNSWNTFGPEIDEDTALGTAQALVDTGLASLGYDTLVLDDVWQAPVRQRDAAGTARLTWDPARFPGGMPALGRRLHALGLRFGLYSSAGTLTCAGLPGSFGHEEADAQLFADWQIDYLKYDNCHVPAGSRGPERFRIMGQALRATGRPIVYSVCEWGRHAPWTWAAGTGAQLWRTGPDIRDAWRSIKAIGFDAAHALAPFAGPGRWNDPDMLVVGMNGRGHVADGGCSAAEYRSHFALWCLLAAPLMIGCDLRSIDAHSLALLGHRGLLAIDQDPLGVPARRLGTLEHEGEDAQVWARPLADGSIAVGCFNLGEASGRRIPVGWPELGLPEARHCRVVDVIADETLGIERGSVTVAVDSHDVAVLRLIPVSP